MQGNKKFMSLFLVLISLFIFVFFTKGYYSDLVSKMDLYEEKKSLYEQKLKQVDNLSKIKKELENSKGKEFVKIKKYSQNFSEDELIREIYSSIDKPNVTRNGKMRITSLSMTKGLKNELGFMESNVNIVAKFSNEQVLKDYLDYLVNDSKYKFFVTSLNVPKIKENQSFSIQIPLKLFYVEKK